MQFWSLESEHGWGLYYAGELLPVFLSSLIEHCNHSPQGQYHTFSFVRVNNESTLLMVSPTLVPCLVAIADYFKPCQ